MNKFNFLFGVTIGIMTMLLVSTTHLVKASSCSSSASAGGVSNQQRAFAGHPALGQLRLAQG
jgi:hypothetical protein